MRRPGPLTLVPTLLVCLTACTGGESSTEAPADPDERAHAQACTALLPADLDGVLGWARVGDPHWNGTTCVQVFDEGRVEVTRSSFGATAVDDLQEGAEATFRRGCERLEAVDEELADVRTGSSYHPDLAFLAPEFRACGNGFFRDQGQADARVRLDSGAVVEIRVIRREQTSRDRTREATRLVLAAAVEQFDDPDHFVP